MGFRFWRRVHILPGISLNFSGSGVSVSVGPCGAKLTWGPRGIRATAGIPGTGLFYTTRLDQPRYTRRARNASLADEALSDTPPEVDYDTLLAPQPGATGPEQAYLKGLRAVLADQIDEAAKWFSLADSLTDGAFMAGMVAMKQKRFRDAATLLEWARARQDELGALARKYGVTPTAQLPVTPQVYAEIRPDVRGLLLALSESWQHAGEPDRALEYLRMLHRMYPADPVLRLGIVELLLDARPDHPDIRKKVLELTENIRNESTIHAALLLYRARALRLSGLVDAAMQVLKEVGRYRRDRPDALFQGIRYERGLCWEALGKPGRARSEFEKIYAEEPDYEDVAQRLGMG
ncbi:MAG: DUF4236 domain-containing protein [Candidatus Hydrogenedentes bacterium]|nr:DUF4236 domain-containing protein [Candidatus Hydrogenedentota bacterium]